MFGIIGKPEFLESRICLIFDIASSANAQMQSYSLTRIFHDARRLLLQQQQNDAILVIER